MRTDPDRVYHRLITDCLTIRDLHTAVRLIPVEELNDIYNVARHHARRDRFMSEAEHTRAQVILSVILDRDLYVIKGFPRDPDAPI